MGFMTEVSILNDGFDQIEDDPKKFVQIIKHAMNDPVHRHSTSRAIGNHANCVQVYRAHHADTPVLYIAWRNSWQVLGRYTVEEQWGDAPADHPTWGVLREELRVARDHLTELERFLDEHRLGV